MSVFGFLKRRIKLFRRSYLRISMVKYPLISRQDQQGNIHYKVQPGKVMLLDHAPTVAAIEFLGI